MVKIGEGGFQEIFLGGQILWVKFIGGLLYTED